MKSTFILFFSLLVSHVFCQTNDQYIIATQGGDSKGTTMSMSWTIGDILTETATTPDGIVTQGFQQPVINVIPVVSNNPKTSTTSDPVITLRGISRFDANVYPNPVSTDVTISVENDSRDYLIEVFNQAGQLVASLTTKNPKESLNLSNWPAAQYMMKISIKDSHETKSFQLIKSN